MLGPLAGHLSQLGALDTSEHPDAKSRERRSYPLDPCPDNASELEKNLAMSVGCHVASTYAEEGIDGILKIKITNTPKSSTSL